MDLYTSWEVSWPLHLVVLAFVTNAWPLGQLAPPLPNKHGGGG